MNTSAHTSYDEVPYPSFSYVGSHPDRLATMATLFGMQPAPVTNCRVLELGCASGGNLIPMAYGLQESEFVGVDLSKHQIDQGKKMVKELELTNVTLNHRDIMDVKDDLGRFDYIIAHGVYSWVPSIVRDKILEICQQLLTPHGVAYISYNTYPGWKMLSAIRDMMLYHIRNVAEPAERAAQGRTFLKFLAEAVPESESGYSSYLKMYARFLDKGSENLPPRDDALLLHDELSEINDPVYFHQFVEHARRYGLQYLAETKFGEFPAGDNANQVSAFIGEMAKNIIEAEQYFDFLHNRTFRQTLLCHQDISLNRVLKPELLSAFYVVGRAKPVADDPDIHSTTKVEQFRSPSNRAGNSVVFSTDHPLVKAALVHLNKVWPKSLSLETLLANTHLSLGFENVAAQESERLAEDRQILSANLLACFSRGLVSLHVHQPRFSLEVSEYPVASPVARLLAQERNIQITNLRHERVDLDEFDRYLIRHLDGKHNYDDLLKIFLSGPVADGSLVVKSKDEATQDHEQIEQVLAEQLVFRLRWLAQASLLIS